MRKSLVSLIALIFLMPFAASAQQAASAPPQSGSISVESQLTQLAGLLGTMQMLQSLCSPQDQDFWRERMQEMIRLEKPSREQQNALINAFNAGYSNAQNKFTSCTAEAHTLAADTAQKGEAIAQALSNAINTGAGPG